MAPNTLIPSPCSYHVPLLSLVTIFTYAADWKGHKTFALQTRHVLSVHCCERGYPVSHHVDSIFVQGHPVRALGVVNQNLWLEGPPNWALLEGLAWKTDRRTGGVKKKKREMLRDYCLLPGSDLWPSTPLRQNTLRDIKISAEDITELRRLIYEKFRTGRPSLTRPFCSKEGKSPSEGYVTQLITIQRKQYNTPHPRHSAAGKLL